jgi:CheY-like chemotaxis protein
MSDVEAGGPIRVLLVDDYADSAISMGRLLRALGYDVRVAFDGLDAVRCATEFLPDAAFVDLSLPLLDGFGVAERLRGAKETSGVRLIAMTGWSNDESLERAIAAGFDLHLVKPVSVDSLTGALATARP